jgi:Flp pilus assembly protein TadG
MIGVQRGSSLKRKPFTGRNGRRGTALIEFALVLPILIILLLVTVDFGRLIQARLIISNVSREGGSIAARQTTVDTSLTTLLKESGKPLNLIGADGKIVITRINAGTSAGSANPTIATQISRGTLARSSSIAAGNANLGLTAAIYNHLKFVVSATPPVRATSDIAEVTVVEVFYKYRPITPFPRGFGGAMIVPDAGGMIVWSRAIF